MNTNIEFFRHFVDMYKDLSMGIHTIRNNVGHGLLMEKHPHGITLVIRDFRKYPVEFPLHYEFDNMTLYSENNLINNANRTGYRRFVTDTLVFENEVTPNLYMKIYREEYDDTVRYMLPVLFDDCVICGSDNSDLFPIIYRNCHFSNEEWV